MINIEGLKAYKKSVNENGDLQKLKKYGNQKILINKER